MIGLRLGIEGDFALHVLIEPRVGQRLEAIRTTIALRVKFIGREVAHHFPITIRPKDITEPGLAYISNVEFSVFLLKKLSAGSDEAVT